jgi:hypothetical protein
MRRRSGWRRRTRSPKSRTGCASRRIPSTAWHACAGSIGRGRGRRSTSRRRSRGRRGCRSRGIDSGILLSVDLALLELTALVAGVGTGDLLRVALPAMLMLFALIGGLYFVLLGGIGRATIGAQLVQAPQHAGDLEGAGVHAVVHRGLRCALAEGSSLVTWMSTAGSART